VFSHANEKKEKKERKIISSKIEALSTQKAEADDEWHD
jgi:hypothetical protein